jgi:hypothetical protein
MIKNLVTLSQKVRQPCVRWSIRRCLFKNENLVNILSSLRNWMPSWTAVITSGHKCCYICRWDETVSLNCRHQWTHCLSPMSMESHCLMALTEETRRTWTITCTSANLSITDSTCTDMVTKPGLRCERGTNVAHTVFIQCVLRQIALKYWLLIRYNSLQHLCESLCTFYRSTFGCKWIISAVWRAWRSFHSGLQWLIG